jgi:NTE family protein
MSKILILSGGGAKGAFQAGVYQQLLSTGYQPDAVAGISVGALNGAMIATGRAERMLRVWENISPKKVLKKNNLLESAKKFITHKLGIGFLNKGDQPLGYYSNKPLRKLLTSNIGQKFIMDYYCGTVNMHNLEYHTHTARKMMVPYTYIDKILASTAIPLVFNPIEIYGELHVDGGIRHMSPLKAILREESPTEIRIILCNKYRGYHSEDRGNVSDVIDLTKRTLDTLLNEIFMKDLREFERVNRLVKQAHEKGYELEKSNGVPYKNYKTYLYEPLESLGDSLNFNKDQALKNMEHGRLVKPIEL